MNSRHEWYVDVLFFISLASIPLSFAVMFITASANAILIMGVWVLFGISMLVEERKQQKVTTE